MVNRKNHHLVKVINPVSGNRENRCLLLIFYEKVMSFIRKKYVYEFFVKLCVIKKSLIGIMHYHFVIKVKSIFCYILLSLQCKENLNFS